MKKVILIKQHPYFPYYPRGTELSFIVDEQYADILVNKGIAKMLENTKEIKRPPNDKMVWADKVNQKRNEIGNPKS